MKSGDKNPVAAPPALDKNGASARKPWQRPQVILQTVSDETAISSHPGVDASAVGLTANS